MRSEIQYFSTNLEWYKFENNTEENDGELYTVDK